ncbi:hypothetical protein PVAP13_2KG501600 [Panicum virgatum]|uniref:KIB1-4 beta-propeller domain-containing protein n=1 Tax=Panicum virgatum TaxID=38727 RepID=A0A8T0WNW2_PANVG|nr:hypothetical protein PVAP13_2KG501600 [Panicum virgatum]
MAPDTRAKRARTGLADRPAALHGSSPLHSDRLTSGPAGLIAERVLSSDVAGYVRFRAACAAWRASCTDPRAQGVADRRFHPRRWIMLPCAYNIRSGGPRRFVNVSTGECVHARIVPDLRRYYVLGPTAEGLLVLCRKEGDHVVQLLNPLTGQLTDFPSADTMLLTSCVDLRLRSFITLYSAGLADDSTAALLYNSGELAVAKPGDEQWTRVKLDLTCRNIRPSAAVLPYGGRLYCVTDKSISVVEAAADRQPRLEPVADHGLAGGGRWSYADWMYPVYDDGGDLILVHRNTAHVGVGVGERYTTYQAKLDAGAVVPTRGLGGQALFLSGGRSVSVSAKISSSISTDTVYECDHGMIVAFDLLGASAAELSFVQEDNANLLCSYVCPEIYLSWAFGYPQPGGGTHSPIPRGGVFGEVLSY